MGRGVAKILAQKGANIAIVARNQNRLAEALAYVSVSDTSRGMDLSSCIVPLIVLQLTNSSHRLQQRTLPSNVSPPYPQT
jgi:3-dehydrosphinganine reductase